MHRRLFSPLAFFALLAACRPPSERGFEQKAGGRTEQPSGKATSSAAVPPGAVCAPGEARCVADDLVTHCEAGERWVEEPCAERSLCIDGACVSLATGARAIDPASLLLPTGDGWLDAWTAVGPLPGPLPEGEATTNAEPSPPPPRPICAPGGYVAVHDKADPPKGGAKATPVASHYVLSGHLVSGRAERVLFAAGAAGRFRLSVDGSRLIDVTRQADPAPFRDETRAPFELSRGVHRIVVEIEQSTTAPTGFWLRTRTPEGGPVPDLLFTPGPDARCVPAELVRTEITKRPVPGGFSVEIRPSFVGLGPRRPVDLPYRVELSTDKGPARVLAEGAMRFAAVGTPEGLLTVPAAIEKAGTYTLGVTVGEGLSARREDKLVYRGALHQRVLELAGKRGAIEQWSLSAGDKDSLLHHLDGLVENLAQGDPDLPWIKRQTAEAEGLVAALGKGESPYATKTGIVRRAYRSPLDGRLQPYGVYVPRAHRPGGKPLPLVVAAHGLGNRPEIALRVVVGEAPESGFNGIQEARHVPALPDLGAFIVAPWGYGNAGQRHLGEEDVLRVVAEMRAHYPIDERRISITGYSLGGTVAFVVPLHYPDVFSASAPLCGYPNLLGWDSIRKAPHTPWEKVLLQKRYIVNWAENGLHLPLAIVHGGKDDPARSELVVDRYKSLGYTHKFDVQEDLDHNVWDYGYEDGDMIGWLKARRRPDVPARVRFVTGEYRYDRAYWVRLLGMEALDRFADIDARHDRSRREIVVTTKNVASFALDLAKGSLAESARVVVDGRPVEGPFAAETLFVVKKDGTFERAAAEPSRAGKKRTGVSGPLDDVDGHPKVIVYGTLDPVERQTNRAVAEHFASFDTFAARYPVKADVDVTDADIAATSLVLIGNSRTNRVTAALEGGLPVRFEPGAIVFRGQRFEGEDVGVSFIHPHPRNEREYVVVHAGARWTGTLASRHLPRFAPDFLVYDGRIAVQRGGHVLARREVLSGGFFDDDWK
jgi:predicted esterase